MTWVNPRNGRGHDGSTITLLWFYYYYYKFKTLGTNDPEGGLKNY